MAINKSNLHSFIRLVLDTAWGQITHKKQTKHREISTITNISLHRDYKRTGSGRLSYFPGLMLVRGMSRAMGGLAGVVPGGDWTPGNWNRELSARSMLMLTLMGEKELYSGEVGYAQVGNVYLIAFLGTFRRPLFAEAGVPFFWGVLRAVEHPDTSSIIESTIVFRDNVDSATVMSLDAMLRTTRQ